MKPATDMATELANELAAAEMIEKAPPDWLEFYYQVRRAVELKVRADMSRLPHDRKAAGSAWSELQYVLRTLALADQEKDLPLPSFLSGEGGVS